MCFACIVLATIYLMDNDIYFGCLVLVYAAIFIALTLLAFSKAKVVSTYPVYKVTIDDTVSMKEFNERYEILNQDGLIYTIKEKRVDTN